MRAGFGAAVRGIVRQWVGAVLLLGVISPGRAASQVLDHDPHARMLPSSSLGLPASSREVGPPANLIVSGSLEPLVIAMWRRSPTFRRQCARLADYPSTTVRIELVLSMSRDLAATTVTSGDAGRDAVVHVSLRNPELYVEHVAHELEHVLEQTDGIDLPTLARQRLDGVVDLGGQYETARARTVGRTVALEMQ
jgi:hypothetical protein